MTDENSPWITPDAPEPSDSEDVGAPVAEWVEPPEPAQRSMPGWLSGADPESESGPALAPEVGFEPEREVEPEAAVSTEPVLPEPPEPEPSDGEEVGSLPEGPTGPIPDFDSFGLSDEEPRLPDMGPERGATWWVWALTVVAVVVVAGAVGYVWWWRAARPITVPDVTGRQPAEATQLLNDLSLRLGAVSEIPTDSAPVGTVVSQVPEQGATLVPNGRVSLVVAVSPDRIRVPDVVGRNLEAAETALATARLRPRIVESFSATVGAGSVIGQLPVAGVELAPGTLVAIVVSRGPAPSTESVPRLAGLTQPEVERMLSGTQLSPVFFRSFDASIPVGEVVAQSPLARSSAPHDSVVQILLSQGPGSTPVTVPNVVGDTERSATSELSGRRLKAVPRVAPSPTVPAGRVISQMPPAGRRTASGIEVGILVSSGPASDVTVPDLAGPASTNVTETISAAGFAPTVLTIEIAGQTPGSVFAQFPEPGAVHPRGLPMVAIVVAAPRP